jgi:hypothetical protein
LSNQNTRERELVREQTASNERAELAFESDERSENFAHISSRAKHHGDQAESIGPLPVAMGAEVTRTTPTR